MSMSMWKVPYPDWRLWEQTTRSLNVGHGRLPELPWFYGRGKVAHCYQFHPLLSLLLGFFDAWLYIVQAWHQHVNLSTLSVQL